MRIVFLGTPPFAVPSLEAIVRAEHTVVAVYTQPDRPKGRGNQLAESAVKASAKSLGLPVLQPERIRRPEPFETLRGFEADMMVVVGYGQIIPQSIIDLPRYGILNVHGSLLPKYRGAAPIQWAIANGERETGVTIMQIDAGLDTGDMLRKGIMEIGPDETAPELGSRLAELGAALLLETIAEIANGTAHPERQNDAEATYAPILKKEDGAVNWALSAATVYNRLRGFTPWPGAYTHFRGMPLTIASARPGQEVNLTPGELRVEKRSLLVGCGDSSSLELLEVQPAGKKRMSVESFINGYQPTSGETMGSSHMETVNT